VDNAFTSDKTLKEGYVRDKPCHHCLYSGLKLEKLSPGASYQDFAVKAYLRTTWKDPSQEIAGPQQCLAEASKHHFRQSPPRRSVQNACYS